MSVLAVDHPSLACRDLDAMADWYCHAFGMKIVARHDVGRHGILIGFDESTRARTMIELAAAQDEGPEPDSIGRAAPGWRHVAFRVDDFEVVFERLKDLGVKFTSDAHEAMAGGRTVLFRDPEGNELQIVQRKDTD